MYLMSLTLIFLILQVVFMTVQMIADGIEDEKQLQ